MILRDAPKPGAVKRGAPFGNRNAVKTGRHTKNRRDLKRRIAAWRRKVRAILAKPPPGHEDAPACAAQTVMACEP